MANSPYKNVKDPYKEIQGKSQAPPKSPYVNVKDSYKDIQGMSQAPATTTPAPKSSTSSGSKKRSSNSNNSQTQAEQTNTPNATSLENKSVSENVRSANNQQQAKAEAQRAELRQAYAQSQAGQRTIAGEETLAPKPKIEQTAITYGIERRPGTINSDVPASKEEQMNRDFSRARQEFQDEVAYNQNQVFTADGEEVRRKITGKGAKATAEVLVIGTASAGVGIAKGVTGAVKDVVTLAIVPKTFDFATAVVTEPKKLWEDTKTEFQKNPISFTTEQVAYGATTGRIVKGIRSGEALRVVQPYGEAFSPYPKGSGALVGQRLTGNLLNIKDFVGELVVASAKNVKEFNDNLGKRGQVNAPGKRRISKAEQRYQTRTGFTKSEIAGGEKPGQSGSYVKSFTYKELLKNEQLQSRVANQPYPDNLGEYKKFSLTRNDAGETLSGQKKRTGYQQFDVKVIDKNIQPQSSSQSTSRKIGFTEMNINGDGTITGVYSRLKVKYVYEPKKPTLNPKVAEPKKVNPGNIKEVKDLISNINEQGKEIFAPVSEPLNTIVKGGNRAGGRIRDEIIARAKAKREVQLKTIADAKELQRQQNTLSATTQVRNVYAQQSSSSGNAIADAFQIVNPKKKNKLSPPTANPEISYAPQVSAEQLSYTKTRTLELPASQPVIKVFSQTPAEKVFNYQDKYKSLDLTQNQLQTPGQVQGMSFAPVASQEQVQSVFQDQGQAQEQGQVQDQGQVVDTTPDQTQKSRSRNRPRIPPPVSPVVTPENVFSPATRPVENKFRPITIKQREKKPETYVPKMKPLQKVSSKKSNGYDVFVRKKGKFQRVNVGALSKVEALNLGAVRVGTSASASFKIEESRLGATQSFKGKGLFVDFYKKGNLFIEKRERRIKSAGEKQEITAKGIQAQKFKKMF